MLYPFELRAPGDRKRLTPSAAPILADLFLIVLLASD